MINRDGIKILSGRIHGRFEPFIKNIRQGSTQEIAKQTFYDCDTLANMITESQQPEWLIELMKECNIHSKGMPINEYVNSVFKIVNIMYDAKNFDWDKAFAITDNVLDYDKLFQEYKAQSKLDDTLEQLTKCWEIILNEPTFKLHKKTKEDIKVVINSIRTNKNSSDSAIRTVIASVYGVVKTVVPYAETGDKLWELCKTIQIHGKDALKELGEIGIKIQHKARQEFLSENFALPTPDELTSESLPMLTKAETELIESEEKQ